MAYGSLAAFRKARSLLAADLLTLMANMLPVKRVPAQWTPAEDPLVSNHNLVEQIGHAVLEYTGTIPITLGER